MEDDFRKVTKSDQSVCSSGVLGSFTIDGLDDWLAEK